MNARRILMALFVLGGAALAVGVWRTQGKDKLAKLGDEARAELRDALKAEREVVRRYVYEPWPHGWTYPYYGWWGEGHRTTVVYPPAPAQPQPAPPRAPPRKAGRRVRLPLD
ncbi:MAG: hypothetical protein HYZ75_05955 [Elusimicrobia bacterium]|nr:hypothetical protein [Elusimicrobiota bacterium]